MFWFFLVLETIELTGIQTNCKTHMENSELQVLTPRKSPKSIENELFENAIMEEEHQL